MKKIIVLILICNLLIIPSVFGNPTSDDTQESNSLINALENTQLEYFKIHKKYEQVLPKIKDSKKLVYYMDEYTGECGSGYIITIEKILNKKRWIKQKHVGCETERHISTNWTKEERKEIYL